MTNASNTTQNTKNTKNTNTTENKTTKSKIDDKQKILDFYNYSIGVLEEHLAKLNEEYKLTPKKSIRQKIENYKIELNRAKHTIKANGKQAEATNDRYLLFIESTGGWHKLTGRSALFFYFDVVSRLKNPARFNLNPDTDNYSVSENGTVSVKLTPEFLKELEQLKILPTEEVGDYGITAFRLPWIYQSEDINRLLIKLRADKEQLNALLTPKNVIPELHIAIKDLDAMVYHNCRRMADPFARQTVGADLYEKSTNAIRRYLEIASGKNSTEEGLKSILKNILHIRYTLLSVSNLNLMEPHNILRIGTQTVLIERMIKKALTMECKAGQKNV